MKVLGTLCGLVIWSGLLILQGTPGPTEEIAEEVVQASHLAADIYQIQETTIGDTPVYQVAYMDYQNADRGSVSIAVDNGRIIAAKAA